MSKRQALACIMVAGIGFALTGPSHAQNIISQFGDVNATVAPQYPATVPNGAQPELNIRAITGFDRTFGYGSSSTNTRRADGNINQSLTSNSPFTEVNSNGHAIYIEMFSPAIGAYNGRGSNFATATNLADGGSTSITALTGSPAPCTLNTSPAGVTPNGTCTTQPQIVEFQKVFGSYRPGDIVVQWSGINDINTTGINTQAIANQIAATDVSNQLDMVRQNITLGAKNYVFIGLADLGTFANFTTLKPTNDPALVTSAALQTNAGNLAGLITIKQQNPGVNIHFFDSNLFVSLIRANPTAYGFTAAGTAPNAYGGGPASAGGFGSINAYNAQPFNVQNQFFTPDGLHWTYRFHEWLSAAIANQLLAPDTLASQADLTQATATAFSNSIMRRLEDYRSRNLMMANMVSADLPVKAPPRVQDVWTPLAFYMEGLYASGDRADRLGGAGIDYNIGGVTVGADYRFSQNFLIGASFNYSSATADLNQGWGHLSSDNYQGSVYASWNYTNWFADVAVSGGENNIKVTRPGLINSLSGNPDGDSIVVQGKTGYLFDAGTWGLNPFNASALKVGPIVGATYSHVHIGSYVETGDPILNQSVGAQSMDGFTGRAGLEFRSAYLWGKWVISPWLDLTAEHDFDDGARVLTTAQTYALLLPISTSVTNNSKQTYGRVAGGFSAQVAQNAFINLNGEATFGRDDGNDYALTGGVKIVW
jgi:outer membrane lipase/esterase